MKLKKMLLTLTAAAVLAVSIPFAAMAVNGGETALPAGDETVFVPGSIPAETGAVESMTPAHAVTVIDVSVWRSRSVKNCMFAPWRTWYSTTWPSTHRGLMRSTYTLMFAVSRRSGHGLSRVVSAAFAAGGRGWGEPPGGGAARR